MSNQRKTILFYGPVGKKDKVIIGGGETGNSKTIKILLDNNYKVVLIPKPYPIIKNTFGGLIYFFQLVSCYINIISKISQIKGAKNLHVTGFYYHLIYFETVLLLTSKIFNITTVYEVRAGGFIKSYLDRTFIYRYFVRLALRISDVILTQGKENITFIQKYSNKPILHYPNFVKDSLITVNNIESRVNSIIIKLVYFGRLARSKNIDFIIRVCKLLRQSGLNATLDLIGQGDKEYLNFIENEIKKYSLSSSVFVLEPMDESALFKVLITKHFFIFPSKEKREGHSNALTEAMSCGVVPIVSDNGFNRFVIDNDYLIPNQYVPQAYAEKIHEIWKKGLWETFSNQVYNNAINNFKESTVSKILLSAYSDD